MPKYAIKAPNGRTYQIDGPDGASDDEVRAEVLRQHPDAGGARQDATFLSTMGRAASNLPGDTVDTLKGLISLPGQAYTAVTHPVETGHALGDMASKAAEVLTGGLQTARNLSPPELRGSAPAFDTKEYDKFAEDNYNKYGTKQNIYQTIGDHPLGPALAAASVAVPALRAAGVTAKVSSAASAAAQALAAKAPGVAQRVETITHAGRRATAAAETMRTEATAQLAAERAAAEQEAKAASQEAAASAQRATRASTLADTSRTQGRTLEARRAQAAAGATPPEPAVGTSRHLTDIGNNVREPALAKETEINAAMRAADQKYRAAMEAVANERAANGVGVSDTPLAKALIKRSKEIVEPDPVKRPTVGAVPAGSAGAKLHEEVLQVLRPQAIGLTEKEAKAAAKAGIEVKTAPDGTLYRVVKPSLQNVDDFRRKLGKILDGTVEGYAGINHAEARELYNGVSNVISSYVKGASKPVQESWAAGKRALSPFERVRTGKAIVGTQDGTAVASVPAARIPGQIVAGGRDTVRQAASVAGDAPVNAAVRTQVQNALTGAKNADAAHALVKPGTTLGDIVAGDPALAAEVDAHIKALRTAEAAGTKATEFGRRASTATGRAKALDTAAGKATTAAERAKATAEKATVAARGYEQELADLELAKPKEVTAKYVDLLNRAHSAGRITDQQLRFGLKHAQRAEKDFGIEATRKKFMSTAAKTLGLSAATAAGVKVLHAAGD
jgi:hypothetical protein